MKLSNYFIASLIVLVQLGQTAGAAPVERWYDTEQVAQGKRLFSQQCATCHGGKAEGTPDWRKPGADGKYPPPPLNGTAHAWHHPHDILRRTVQEGGAKLGGSMPPFKDKLSPAEIDAVIAYVQSQWSDEIYNAWQDRQTAMLKQPLGQNRDANADPVTGLLQRRVGTRVGKPATTPVKGVFQSKVGMDYVYLTADGRYAFTGDLIDLESGRNLTDEYRAKDALTELAAFSESDKLIYPAAADRKARLTVFTDTSCPYCRKLHAEVPELQKAGVEVAYVPFPRGGTQGQGYGDMTHVWCAGDRRKAMDAAMQAAPSDKPPATCEAAKSVQQGYRLGSRLGIRGTPALFLPNGRRIDGYIPAKRVLKMLGL